MHSFIYLGGGLLRLNKDGARTRGGSVAKMFNSLPDGFDTLA